MMGVDRMWIKTFYRVWGEIVTPFHDWDMYMIGFIHIRGRPELLLLKHNLYHSPQEPSPSVPVPSIKKPPKKNSRKPGTKLSK